MRRLYIATVLWTLLSLQPSVSATVQLRQVLPFEFDSMVWTVYADSVMPDPLPAPHTQSRSLQFAAFDPSLGTLTNAYLSYEGDYAISFAIAAGTRAPHWPESPVSGGQVVGNGTVSYALGLTATGMGAEHVLHGYTYWANVSGARLSNIIWLKGGGTGPADSGGNTGVLPWVHAGDLELPLFSLADGLDVLGEPVDVTLEKEMNAFLWFTSFVDPTFSYITNFRNAWSGQIALTYVYETGGPSPTPEPGLPLLLGTGLALLFVRVRGPGHRNPSARPRPPVQGTAARRGAARSVQPVPH